MEYACSTCPAKVTGKDRFHIDDKSFCSMKCLQPYRAQIRAEEQRKRELQEANQKRFSKIDHGGPLA